MATTKLGNYFTKSTKKKKTFSAKSEIEEN